MKRVIKSIRNREKGIALFMAMFTLMLLAAIGLAMLFASDTETSIDANFRDQQLATYAAFSGLQEARDRMIPGGSIPQKITWPTGLPSTTAKNIIYIINPTAGETVAPWDPNNRYYDWELCSAKENMPSGFCTSGQPPSGAAWYEVYHDEQSGTGAKQGGVWNRSAPLRFKWVRINLKADNMIVGAPIMTSGTNGSLVCYDGTGQIQKPAGYTDACEPTGALSGINVPPTTTVFSTATPTVTIAAPTGTGTQAVGQLITTPTTSSGTVTNLTLTSGGSGYSSAPTVTFVGGGATTPATATATIASGSGKVVGSVAIAAQNNGCYASGGTQNLSFAGGGGSGAAATVTMSSTPNCVLSWTVTGACSADKGTTKTITTTNGGGSGFSGTITFHNGTGNVSSSSISAPGSGYTSAPTAFSGSSCSTGVNITAQLGYTVQSVALTSGGSGYTTAPTVSLSPTAQTGTATTYSATLGGNAGGQVTALTLTSPGVGYTSAPTVQFSGGGGGTGAAGTASISTGYNVTGIDFTCSGCTPGSGYTSPPAVTINGGITFNTTGVLAGTTYYGQVAVITAYAETGGLIVTNNRQGSKALMQEEITTAPRSPFQFQVGGAITIPGPNPNFGTPNSNNFYVNGTDANSCGGVAAAKPSIDVYDPTTSNTTAIDGMISQLSRPDHYPGLQASPDVEVGSALNGTTPDTLSAFVNSVLSQTPSSQQMMSNGAATSSASFWNPAGYNTYTLDNSNMNPTSPPITFVQGNATISGNVSGSGLLVVTGTLSFSGNYSFNGVILVIGQGTATYNGGGNGQVNGSLYVAKIADSSGNLLTQLGTPTLDYSGGGGNGVQYDHCKVNSALGNIPQIAPPASSSPLIVVSQRAIYN